MFQSSSTIRGSWLEKAFYATYQTPVLGGTVLAGLRVEDRRYDIADGASSPGPGGTHLFPSLHLERRLAGWLVGNLSYSRRVAWPEIQNLSAVVRFSDPTTAAAGNPFLQPELTDSYEAKFKLDFSDQSLDLTLYSRLTHDLFSTLGEVGDDSVLVTRPVNLGRRRLLGVSLSLRGPLGGGFHYSANADLADQDIEREGSGPEAGGVGPQYNGSLQIDYRDGVEGRRGADHVMVRLRYSGPIDLGLFRVSPYVGANASWSHALTDRLSAVLSIDDLIGPPTIRSTYFSDSGVARQFSRTADPRVTFSLTYSLNPPARR